MRKIGLRDVSVVVGGARLLDAVSFDVEPGEWLAVIGPNGAGKTTLLRAMAGLVATTGSVEVDGVAVGHSRRTLARRIAYVPQTPLVPEGMDVREYTLLGRTAHLGYLAMESRHDFEVVNDVLDRLDLAAFADRPLTSLSGGERQRAVLARALVQEAPVLLLDEPTTALDLGHQQQVLELVDELRRERGLAVVSAMHDLTLTAQFAERLVLLSGGRVAVAGTPDEVLTEEILSTHWGAHVRVISDPDAGLVVLPLRESANRPAVVP